MWTQNHQSIPMSPYATVFIVGLIGAAYPSTNTFVESGKTIDSFYRSFGNATFFGHFDAARAPRDTTDNAINIFRLMEGTKDYLSVRTGGNTNNKIEVTKTMTDVLGGKSNHFFKFRPFIMAVSITPTSSSSQLYTMGPNEQVNATSSSNYGNLATTNAMLGKTGQLYMGGTCKLNPQTQRPEGQEFCLSHISEVIYYNIKLTSTNTVPAGTTNCMCPQDIQTVVAYLAWKWGFASSSGSILEGGNPYIAGGPLVTPAVSAARASSAQASSAQQSAAQVSSARASAAQASAARGSAAQASAGQASAAQASAAQQSAAIESSALAVKDQITKGSAIPEFITSPIPMMLGGWMRGEPMSGGSLQAAIPAPISTAGTLAKVLWLDGSDASTFLNTAGSVTTTEVEKWKDKSGSGNDVIFTTKYTAPAPTGMPNALKRPYVISGTINGNSTTRGIKFWGGNVLTKAFTNTQHASRPGFTAYIVYTGVRSPISSVEAVPISFSVGRTDNIFITSPGNTFYASLTPPSKATLMITDNTTTNPTLANTVVSGNSIGSDVMVLPDSVNTVTRNATFGTNNYKYKNPPYNTTITGLPQAGVFNSTSGADPLSASTLIACIYSTYSNDTAASNGTPDNLNYNVFYPFNSTYPSTSGSVETSVTYPTAARNINRVTIGGKNPDYLALASVPSTTAFFADNGSNQTTNPHLVYFSLV